MEQNQEKKGGRPKLRKTILEEKRAMRKSFDEERTADQYKIKGCMLRFFNDDDKGRIHWALSRGYEFVSPSAVENGKTQYKLSGTDAKASGLVSKRVGRTKEGAPLTAYLMGIEEELYKEGFQEKQKVNDDIMGQITRKAPRVDGMPVDEDSVRLREANVTTSFS